MVKRVTMVMSNKILFKEQSLKKLVIQYSGIISVVTFFANYYFRHFYGILSFSKTSSKVTITLQSVKVYCEKYQSFNTRILKCYATR